MAKKDDLELRPVMTRIPEGLRRRLERHAKWLRRSMNAEIVHRLQESFDIPDQADNIVSGVSGEIDTALSNVESTLAEIQSQNRAILSHLGLPDPAEDQQRVREDARALGEAQRRNRDARRKAAMERAGRKEEGMTRAEALDAARAAIEKRFGAGGTPSAETRDGEKK